GEVVVLVAVAAGEVAATRHHELCQKGALRIQEGLSAAPKRTKGVLGQKHGPAGT
ncbi:MAG: hypothetical protein RL685_4764, partial [Pseudomonadota bacterium]